MVSLFYLHIIALIIVYLNLVLFNNSKTANLGSKYFLINYIYHNHKKISCFLITYPFIIILLYFLFENILPVGALFISVLHVYFLYEITSNKNITKKEEYLYWYKKNVKHSFSMHAYDKIKKDFNFLNEKRSILTLFKFEMIFLVIIVIETEVMLEVFTVLDSIK